MNTNHNHLVAFVFLSAGIVLTACSPKQETYTADYLYNNDELRTQVLADCQNNKQSQENCQAANEAMEKKAFEEYSKKANR